MSEAEIETTAVTETPSQNTIDNKNEESITDQEKLLDKDLFCVPLLPPVTVSKPTKSKPITITQSKNPGPASLKYTEPEWTSKPPPALDENQLDDEGFCNHYYLEVIKTGSVLESIPLTKPFMTFGRLDLCDVLCEHPSLSRYHTILQYSNGETDTKFPKGFYAFDLNSTHGTFINKKRIEGNQYIPLNIDSIIKFGLSTRMYILHGPMPMNNSNDLNIDLSHEQMRQIKKRQDQISMKLKARKELDEEEMEEEEKSRESDGVSWGMDRNEEDLDDEPTDKDTPNPFAVIGDTDESYYSSDPKKALRVYFERQGEDLEYDVEDLAVGKFKCSIRLPICNKLGEPMYAEVTQDGKKKECVAACALEACRILNSEGVLKESRAESQRKKKAKDWESNDYYDSDEDNFLDRTGEVERKRLRRMAKAGKLDEKTSKSMPGLIKNKVHTFDSLVSDMKVLLLEKHEIESKVEKCKAVFKAVEEDDLDSYIESLKVGSLDTVTRAKLKKRLTEIRMELLKLEKLLSVAKSKDFDLEKFKKDIEMKFDNNEESIVKKSEPVKVSVPVTKNHQIESKTVTTIQENSVSVKESVITVDKPLSESTSKLNKPKSKLESDLKVKSEARQTNDELNDLADELNVVKKKLKLSEEKFEEYSNSADYAVWVPPKDQSGDGKTKLNEKFGY